MNEPEAQHAVRRAVEAHDHLIAALYAGERVAAAGAHFAFNAYIEEMEWNHAGRLTLPDPADGRVSESEAGEALDRLLDETRSFFSARQRKATVLLDPLTRPADLAVRLAARGWSEAYRHAGLVFPSDRTPVAVQWPAGTRLFERGCPPSAAPNGAEAFLSMAVFASIFEASFAETAADGLSIGYHQAFPAAVERPSAGIDVVHTLVTIDGEPAAVGSRATREGVCGLYNLGVAPRFRRHGLGGAITLHRVLEGRAAGAEVVYLLTEDPRVEASQLRRGFVKAFEFVGWEAPPVANQLPT